MTPDENERAAESGGPGGPGGEAAGDADEIPGMNADDEVIPASPGRRREARLIGLFFLVAILLFLVLFIATNLGRSEGGGFF